MLTALPSGFIRYRQFVHAGPWVKPPGSPSRQSTMQSPWIAILLVMLVCSCTPASDSRVAEPLPYVPSST